MNVFHRPSTSLGLVMLLLPGMVAAEIFKCTDDQGQVSFQETPCSFELSQEGIDEALALLQQVARNQDSGRFAEQVTSNRLGGFADSQGRTVLMLACSDGSIDMCRWALDAGEDPYRRDKQNHIALDHAARAGRVENVNLLLMYPGAEPYRPGDRVAALKAAISGDQFDTTLMLLETGVDPNFQRNDAPTALALAVDMGDSELVRLLVRHGADPAQAMSGGSPVERANQSDRLEALSALNPGTQRFIAGGFDLNVPTPLNAWECDTYLPILKVRTRQLLAADVREAKCYVLSQRIADLDQVEPRDLGLFHFTWSLPQTGTVGQAFAETAAHYQRLYEEVFEQDDHHIGVMQVSRIPAGGGSSLVSTCAVIVTALTDHLGTVYFCRYGEQEYQDTQALQSTVRLWQERVVALNSD
jgi:hypothetical protein